METPASQDTGSSGPRASRPLIVPPTTEVASSPSAPPTSLSVVPRASQGSPSAPPTSLSIVPPGEDEVSPGPIIYHTPRYALPPEGRRESLILDEEQGAIPVGPPVRTSSDPYAGTASKAAQSLSATNIPTPSHRMPASPRKVAPVTPDGGTVMTVPGVDLSMPGLGLAESPNRPVSEAASPPNQPLDIEDAPMGLLSDDTQRVRKKPMSYRGMFYAILALSVGVVIIGLSAGVAKNKQLLDAAQKVQGNDNGNNPPIANPPTEDMGGNFDVAVSSEDFQGTYVKLMEDNFENVEAIHHSRLCTEKGCMRLEMEMDHNNDDYETGSTIVVSGKRDLKDARQKTLKVNKVTKVKGPQDKKADPPPPDGGMGDGGMGGMRRAMQAVSQTRTAVVLIVNWIGSPSIDKALLTWQAWQALLGPSNSVKDMLKYCTWDQYKMNFDVSTKAGDYANDTTLDFYWVDVPTKCTSNTFPCPAVYDVDTCTTGNYDGDYETVQYAMNVLGLTRSTWQHVIMVHPSRTCWPSAGLGTLGCSGAFCNTWISTDSVEWPSIHLHELGHNFGLEHAGIVGDEYGDRTAVMGRAYGSSYPCFHAPHAAQLGIITPIALSATNFCPGANYVLDIQSMSETPTNSAIKITPDWTTDTFSYFVQFKTATKYDGTITLTNADFSPTLAPLAIKKHSVASTTFGIHMTKLTAGTAWTGIAADPTLSVLLQSSTLAPNLAATVAPYGTSVANLKLVRGSCTVGYYGNTYTITSTSTSIPTNCQGASPAPCLPNQCLWGTLPATTGVNGVICPQNTPGVSQSISCMLGYQFNSSATSISEVCKACTSCPTCDASCSDGAKSLRELGVDCGGTTCTKACDTSGYQTVTEPDYYTCVDVTGSALTFHNTRWTYVEMLRGYPAYQSSGRPTTACTNGICYMNVATGKSYYKMTTGKDDTSYWCGYSTGASARNSNRPLDVTKHTSWQYPDSTCTWIQDTGVKIRPCQCSNGIKDSFEQGVDCGGPCAPCTSSCSDAKRSGLETDVDCGGGTCTACGEGQGCLATSDCTTGLTCNSCGMCVGAGGLSTATASLSPSVSISRSVAPSSTTSASPSPSASPSLSVSRSLSASSSPSLSPSRSVSASSSPSLSPSRSASVSPSRSITGSITASISRSRSISITASISRSRSITASVSPSRSRTASVSPSRSRTATSSLTRSRSPAVSGRRRQA